MYAVGDCAGYWQLAHTAFAKAKSPRRTHWSRSRRRQPRVPRPIYIDPEVAGVGLTEREAREQYGDDVVTGVFSWAANGRALMQNETVGWVKSIHEAATASCSGS